MKLLYSWIYLYHSPTDTICGGIYMKIHSLPAGGAVGVEIEVSPVTAVHKTELCSQTLLYQKLHARWNENEIQNFLKIVGFLQKYSDIKTLAPDLYVYGSNHDLAPPQTPTPNHSNFRRRDLF